MVLSLGLSFPRIQAFCVLMKTLSLKVDIAFKETIFLKKKQILSCHHLKFHDKNTLIYSFFNGKK